MGLIVHDVGPPRAPFGPEVVQHVAALLRALAGDVELLGFVNELRVRSDGSVRLIVVVPRGGSESDMRGRIDSLLNV